jgi:hypothetical protein
VIDCFYQPDYIRSQRDGANKNYNHLCLSVHGFPFWRLFTVFGMHPLAQNGICSVFSAFLSFMSNPSILIRNQLVSVGHSFNTFEECLCHIIWYIHKTFQDFVYMRHFEVWKRKAFVYNINLICNVYSASHIRPRCINFKNAV